MNEMQHSLIQELLLKGKQYYDMKVFKEYCQGLISIEECREQFAKNNKIPDEYIRRISVEVFEEWLNSIGWKR